MNKLTTTFILLLLPCCFLLGQSATIKVDKATKKAVKAELQDMIDTDQKYRWMIMFGETDQSKLDSLLNLPVKEQFKIFNRYNTPEYGLSQSTLDSIWALQNELDSINLVRLKSIIAEYGWPDEKRFGRNSADIMLVHADAEIVFEMEDLLLGEVKAKRINAYEFAKLWDRKLTSVGKKQKYGTVYFYGKDGGVLPPNVENADSARIARESIGIRNLKKEQKKRGTLIVQSSEE